MRKRGTSVVVDVGGGDKTFTGRPLATAPAALPSNRQEVAAGDGDRQLVTRPHCGSCATRLQSSNRICASRRLMLIELSRNSAPAPFSVLVIKCLFHQHGKRRNRRRRHGFNVAASVPNSFPHGGTDFTPRG